MKNSLYDRRHFKEYLLYGFIAGILFIIPSWIFLSRSDYNDIWIIYAGAGLFMFAIMLYAYKLSRRRIEYKSAWMMIIATHFAIIVGIVVSVLLTFLLCFLYIPGFLSGNSPEVIKDSPAALDLNNTGTVMMLFVCATIVNFGAGGFIGVLGPYVFKIKQTKDKSAVLEPHVHPKNAS